MKGIVQISKRNVHTGVVETVIRENLILDAMYPQIIQLLGSGGVNYINRMQFGTGSEYSDPSQIILQMPITPIKTVVASSIPALYQVSFSAYLESTEANGFSISEAGLLTAGGVLVARTTFAGQAKNSDYQFSFAWTVSLKS